MSILRGKTALITGASSGIGEAIALALAAEGVNVGLVGRDEARLNRVGLAAAQHRVETWNYSVDLEKEDDCRWLAESVLTDFGALDMLIHSAAAIVTGEVADTPPSEFERLFRVNVLAPYTLTHLLLPALKESQGDIVFVNSRAAFLHHPRLSQYCATKAALQAFANSLREEIGGEGIRVLSLFPGRVATPMQEKVVADAGGVYRPDTLPQPADIASGVIAALKLPPHAEMTDLTIRPQPHAWIAKRDEAL